MTTPPGWVSMSPRVRAASSERRSAEAKPRRMIAASRAPLGVERSMASTIWRISACRVVGPGVGGGADDAAQPAAHGADGLVAQRVGEPVPAVRVGDGGAVGVEGADRQAGGGSFGEVGADRCRVRGHRVEVTGCAPAFPPLPGSGVDGAGGVGVTGRHRLGDPGGVGHRQPSRHSADFAAGRSGARDPGLGRDRSGSVGARERFIPALYRPLLHPVPNQAASHGSTPLPVPSRPVWCRQMAQFVDA